MMMYSDKTKNSKYPIIFGLGPTGMSCVRYAHRSGISICVIDTRLSPPNLAECQQQFPQLEMYLGKNINLDDILNKADFFVVGPGIAISDQPILQKAQQLGIPIIGDIEWFAQSCKKPFVAITGSNGKTTVTTLTGELLKAVGLNVGVGGNIGTPALDLLAPECAFEAYVLELSSFQLDTTFSLHPHAATILNITPDHLDRYSDYESYILSKQKIVHNADNVIINRHCAFSVCPERLSKEPIVSFGLDAPGVGHFGIRGNDNQDYLAFGQQLLLPITQLKLLGEHNYLNVLAALALARALGLALGLSFESMLVPMINVLKTFQGLDHRCQWINMHKGVTFINDSKGTNIGASLAALESMVKIIKQPGKIILIAGGDGKNQDFDALRLGLDKMSDLLRTPILIGKDAKTIQQALRASITSICKDNITQAVAFACQQAQPGDIVLLSPSCSSLDQYSSYVARGQDFIQAVEHQIKNGFLLC